MTVAGLVYGGHTFTPIIDTPDGTHTQTVYTNRVTVGGIVYGHVVGWQCCCGLITDHPDPQKEWTPCPLIGPQR